MSDPTIMLYAPGEISVLPKFHAAFLKGQDSYKSMEIQRKKTESLL